MSPAILIAILVMLLASLLTVWHVRSWELSRKAGLEKPEHDYRWDQFRRRVKASTLLALVGVAMMGGELIADPVIQICFWGGVSILLLWIVWIAMMDMGATRRFFQSLSGEHQAKLAELEAEVGRLQRRESNGQAHVSEEAE